MPPRFVVILVMLLWSKSIVGLIVNLGMAESLTLRCVAFSTGEVGN
jgi:hypothetical protein